ncbi:MAG: lipid-A-disaccharide synthase [Prevotella sp.]|nr:lipid-A-disaccharide synthase [Prevotella sp.]
MKYYLIAGEASGDLHASHLMRSLQQYDPEAQFRFFGGDLMAAVGGTRVRHYRELAYMGFVPVLLHLPTILRNMKLCKSDILAWQPDCVILIDYPGFNLDIAKYVKSRTTIPVYYYIAPKLWAWKEYRIRRLKRDVDELFSILPFEVAFFEQKHGYPIHYVGNPTADEVRQYHATHGTVAHDRKTIALLAGSRRQEINDNLPTMLEAVRCYENNYHIVLAGAPGIEPAFYERYLQGRKVDLVFGQTYALLQRARAALVTSGTATLETALFRVPQVVCYDTPLPWLAKYVKPLLLNVKFISLVNLIAAREVVPELVADTFTASNLRHHLAQLLADGETRDAQLRGYEELWRILGDKNAPDNAARQMVELLKLH